MHFYRGVGDIEASGDTPLQPECVESPQWWAQGGEFERYGLRADFRLAKLAALLSNSVYVSGRELRPRSGPPRAAVTQEPFAARSPPTLARPQRPPGTAP